MRALILLLLAAPTLSYGQSALERAKAEDPYLVHEDDAGMSAAIKTAQQTLDTFLTTWRKPPAGVEDFAVKVGVAEGMTVEYFWIMPFEAHGTGFSGEINNQPQIVSNVALGQRIAFQRNDIVDWLYMQSGRMIGNYTTCAMLVHESAESQAEFRAAVGLECEP